MSKYIDMEVVADAKIDTIKQSSLKLKESGFTIAPVLSTGESTAGIRYSPSGQALDGCRLAGFGSTSGNADGNYTYDSSSGVFTLNNNKVVHENNLWSIYIGSTVVWKSNNDADWPWDVSGWTLQVGGGDTGNVTAIYGDPTPAKFEYSDGSEWNEFTAGGSSSGIASEPIEFTLSDLDADGILTIQHNLNGYPFGLGYTHIPKNIEFVDLNTLKLDYSDRDASVAINASIWFAGSSQSMLVAPSNNFNVLVADAGSSDVNGTYVLDDQWLDKSLTEITSSSATMIYNHSSGSGGSGIALVVGAPSGVVYWQILRYGTGYYSSEQMTGAVPTKWPWQCTWTKATGSDPVPTLTKVSR